MLQDFAAYVEGKVFAVDNAADEAEVLREKLARVVHDEDTFDVELDASLVVGLIEIKRGLGRDVEKSGVLEGALGAGMEPEERILPITGNGLVKLFVVFVF